MFAFLKKLFKREEKTVVTSRLWVDIASPEPVKKMCLSGVSSQPVAKVVKPRKPRKVKEVVVTSVETTVVKLPAKRGRKPKAK